MYSTHWAQCRGAHPAAALPRAPPARPAAAQTGRKWSRADV